MFGYTAPMFRLSVLIAVGVVLAGCRAVPRSTERTPDDFAISVSTSGPADGVFAPAWFMVEADGVLRAATGLRSARSAAPPAVRALTRRQMDELWGMTRAAGLADAPSDGAAPAEPTCEIEVAALGRRRAVRADSSSNAELKELVQRLRELAWVPAPPAP